MVVAYYQLERTTIVDHAGTPLTETMFTSSCERLEAEIRRLFGLRNGFDDDVLPLAWMTTVERGENALASFHPPTLTVHGGAPWRRLLLPDTSVVRGDVRVEVVVDQQKLREALARPRAKNLAVLRVGEATFRSLEALGDAPFLEALRRAEGEEVSFDLGAMLKTIPALEGALLAKPLRFVPFFDSENFATTWTVRASSWTSASTRAPGTVWYPSTAGSISRRSRAHAATPASTSS